jgi:predicted outer membrane repeat protein
MLTSSGLIIGPDFKQISVPPGTSVHVIGEGGNVALDAAQKDRFFDAPVNSTLVLTGLVLKNGQVGDGGGGALSIEGTVKLIDCSFISNSVTGYNAGGAIIVRNGDTGELSATNCIFSENTCTAWGGAICTQSSKTVTLTGCNFTKSSQTGDCQNDVEVDHREGSPLASVTFSCPEGYTGAPVKMPSGTLHTDQLPPSKQIVHCVPNLAD